MTTDDIRIKFRLLCFLLVLPFLVGSQCTVLFSSGGNDDDDDKDDEKIIVVSSSGVLGTSPVVGADYRSGAIRGVTGKGGEFEYEPDSPVQFSIGDIALGEPVKGKALITVDDLVPETDAGTPARANIKRLLKSLDVIPGDGAITIPADARARALQSNVELASYIAFLDFADDHAFVNAASQLIAVLTQDYPFTAVLSDDADSP